MELFIFIFVVASAFAAHLPKDLKTCKKSDPKFNECLKVSIEDALRKLANGNKELGIAPLEPLAITEISVARNPGSSVSIDQKFSNIKLHGMSSATIIKAELNYENNELYVEAFAPELRSEADFEIAGQLLIFPINAKGPSNITMTNLKSSHRIKGERVTVKGKEYINLTKYEMSLMPEDIQYNFKNVLGGEAARILNEQVDKVINENSVSIFNEVRPATEQSYGLVFLQIANQIFSKVPIEEIYKD